MHDDPNPLCLLRIELVRLEIVATLPADDCIVLRLGAFPFGKRGWASTGGLLHTAAAIGPTVHVAKHG